ncbi:MAG: ABC transporter ATP-binding protein [Thaumarchaeota archaeon]|nr:ABC transporter ATP-binding protein [Nitrososphaerota archaeon]
MNGIRKQFGNTIALADVDIKLNTGEIHALLGENGAGKSTLMNVLFGLYKPDKGTIAIAGRPVKMDGPKTAISLGVFMVHQHFRLIGNFTSLENIMVNSSRGMMLNYNDARNLAEKAAEAYGLGVDLDTKVKRLPVGAQQRVELLKALSTKPKLLILDEPTSSLTPQEADSVLESVKKFAERGLGVVFITHKIREVFEVSDRITVLKQGQIVGSFSGKEVTDRQLIELMMGSQERSNEMLQFSGPRPESAARPEKILEVKGITVLGAQREVAVQDTSFSIAAGEILGLAGVSGNGQREIAEAITGIRKVQHGQIVIQGVDVTSSSPAKMLDAGVTYIPEDRMQDGLLPTMSIVENLFLGHHREPPFARGPYVNYKEAVSEAQRAISDYSVKAEGPEETAAKLSGGNIQRLLIARSLIKSSKLLVAHNPTRGLDLKSTDFVLKRLLTHISTGSSVLLISEDLDELMLVSDRISAIYKGRVSESVTGPKFDKYVIGAMMAGENPGGVR